MALASCSSVFTLAAGQCLNRMTLEFVRLTQYSCVPVQHGKYSFSEQVCAVLL